jgi:hypothetical protein
MFGAAGTKTIEQHLDIASCWDGARLGPVDAWSGRDSMVREIHRFAQRTLRCSAAIFYWVKDDQAAHDAGVTGLPPSLWSEYLAEMVAFDPLSVRALLSTRANLARLPAGAGLSGRRASIGISSPATACRTSSTCCSMLAASRWQGWV